MSQTPTPQRSGQKFDRALGAALGLPDWKLGNAAEICRALYMTDGDLIDASNELSTWSSQKNERAAEDFTTL